MTSAKLRVHGQKSSMLALTGEKCRKLIQFDLKCNNRSHNAHYVLEVRFSSDLPRGLIPIGDTESPKVNSMASRGRESAPHKNQ